MQLLASTTPIRRAAALSWRLTWQFETRQLTLCRPITAICAFFPSLTDACYMYEIKKSRPVLGHNSAYRAEAAGEIWTLTGNPFKPQTTYPMAGQLNLVNLN